MSNPINDEMRAEIRRMVRSRVSWKGIAQRFGVSIHDLRSEFDDGYKPSARTIEIEEQRLMREMRLRQPAPDPRSLRDRMIDGFLGNPPPGKSVYDTIDKSHLERLTGRPDPRKHA